MIVGRFVEPDALAAVGASSTIFDLLIGFALGVGNRWAYVCLIIDLFNREIIGLSVGWHKTA